MKNVRLKEKKQKAMIFELLPQENLKNSIKLLKKMNDYHNKQIKRLGIKNCRKCLSILVNK